VKSFSALALAMFAAAAFGQEPATPAPEIPFDSVPNLLKLPADLHMGEALRVSR
jgi:hypothetical protein